MNTLRQDVLMGLVAAAVAATSLFTWLACRWHYGRQARASAGRLAKAEQSRQLANQQLALARSQIEALKLDAAARPATRLPPAAPAPSAVAASRTPVVDAAAERRRLEAELDPDPDSDLMPLRSNNGFADTQIMS